MLVPYTVKVIVRFHGSRKEDGLSFDLLDDAGDFHLLASAEEGRLLVSQGECSQARIHRPCGRFTIRCPPMIISCVGFVTTLDIVPFSVTSSPTL